MTKAVAAPQITRLKDYTPPTYLLETIHLNFDLREDDTEVKSQLKVNKNKQAAKNNAPLVLSGEQLELKDLKLNGKSLTPSDYKLTEEQLVIPNVPDTFDLEITTRIKPQENTALSGLYRSKNIFCTQCEAEGFRRITFFPDRPDILTRFTTTIIADQEQYPILLSNGNLVAKKTLDSNKHVATWVDPFKKPSYLFALVAGDLDRLEDKFITKSGREVSLQIFVNKGQTEKAQHAMNCIKTAMRWDEEAYGREYDLDIFMVVAIDDFNMGAMENKGLNIFNAKYILAKPETATDDDYQNILSVIGHEYFHNWSGNRVTCRDWFQLSLKEGLTVFREQEFTQQMTSPLVARINDVRHLRNTQFREDAGPLAHPVQPDSYIEINNFYTTTIYEKGAEVIRMMKVLLGPETFRKAMDLYFSRNDGSAVTIEDFVKAMEDASGSDLTQFRLWYHQAGTPELTVTSSYDAKSKTYTLKVKQSCPPTPNQPEKKPFHIPLAISLLDSKGNDLSVHLQGAKQASNTHALEIKKPEEVFNFVNIEERPTPSLLRGFSAPVKLNYEYSDAELSFLLAHDSDGFNRWEAGQKIAARLMLKLIADYQAKKALQLNQDFIATYHQLLQNQDLDKALLRELLTLPSEIYMGELLSIIDVDAIHAVREFVKQELARHLSKEFAVCYENNLTPGVYSNDQKAIAKRSLKNTALLYLMQLNTAEIREQALKQFRQANNMTDQINALAAFVDIDCPERTEVLNEFYKKWQKEALVIDMWFAIQARSKLPGTLTQVKQLQNHPAFQIKNPNNVRSLIGVFCQGNLAQFHAKDGKGYEFLQEQVLRLDPLNPLVAARLLTPLTDWRRYDHARQQLMKKGLETIVATKNLSKDVFEIASKSLS